MDFAKFPFDKHTCLLRFGSAVYPSELITFNVTNFTRNAQRPLQYEVKEFDQRHYFLSINIHNNLGGYYSNLV